MSRSLHFLGALLFFWMTMTGCIKESPEGGGLRVSFTGRHAYQYQSMDVLVTSSYYDGILN